jgi:hypothetical protein
MNSRRRSPDGAKRDIRGPASPLSWANAGYEAAHNLVIWVSVFAGTNGRVGGRYTSSGQGTMVDLTVFIAIASLTARETPSSSNE